MGPGGVDIFSNDDVADRAEDFRDLVASGLSARRHALAGGGLAVIPIAAMDGPFWDLTGDGPVANPLAWSHLTPR